VPTGGSSAGSVSVQRLLGVLAAVVSDVRALAVFRLRTSGPTLLGSRLVDRHVLACVDEIYEAHGKTLSEGLAAYVRRDEAASSAGAWCPPRAVLVVPAFWGEPARLVGLLYVDSGTADPWTVDAVERVGRWGPLVGKVVAEEAAAAKSPVGSDLAPRSAGGVAPAPPPAVPGDDDALLRAALLYGFKRHGWRPTAVARWMGVTRTTLWKSCRRLGITEESFERDRIGRALERYRGDLVRVCTVLRISRAALVDRMARFHLGHPRQRRAKAESPSQQAQRRTTLRALQKHKWRMKPAAEALGISVSALWARRGRFGLHGTHQKQAAGRVSC
jgi:hypothetical protein